MKRMNTRLTITTLHAALLVSAGLGWAATANTEMPCAGLEKLDVEKVLDSARRAAKRDAWCELADGLHLQGETDAGGVDARFELFLAADGRYRYEMDGPFGRVVNYDGRALSTRERRGPATLLGGHDREGWHYPQWLHGGYWLEPACPLELTLIEQSADEVTLELAFPDSASPARLTLDRETWLPRELIQESLGAESVMQFHGYEEVAGIPLARLVTSESRGVKSELRVARARPAAASAGDRYAHDLSPPRDVHFDDDSEPEVELMRVASGHILVHPRAEGQDVGWFILDTGAGQICIDPKVADSLELQAFGSVPAVGVAGSVRASYRQGTTLELGPMRIDDPVYVEIDLAFLSPLFGVEVAGICGYDVFARAVVALDLEGPSLALYEPGTFELDEQAWSPLTFSGRIPNIRCRFEGDRDGLFKLDLGDAGTISFYSPAVESLGLLEGRAVEDAQVGGVGGLGAAKSGTLEWFEVGGHRLEDLLVTFSLAETGVFASDRALGNLGSEMLKPFRLVFDYPNARIALLPRD